MYSVPVCAVSNRSDRYVWTVDGTSEEVIATMMEEQGVSQERIEGDYEIEESYVDVPESIVNEIIADVTTYILTCCEDPVDPIKLITTDKAAVLSMLADYDYLGDYSNGERWWKVTSWSNGVRHEVPYEDLHE